MKFPALDKFCLQLRLLPLPLPLPLPIVIVIVIFIVLIVIVVIVIVVVLVIVIVIVIVILILLRFPANSACGVHSPDFIYLISAAGNLSVKLGFNNTRFLVPVQYLLYSSSGNN